MLIKIGVGLNELALVNLKVLHFGTKAKQS
mgnify:CR=1 FL=1